MTTTIPSLIPGTIYETIVTTSNKQCEPNAAPMGIILDKENNIILQPYLQSDTFQNLWEKERAIINFTQDPKLFTYCTLFQDELSKNAFTKTKNQEDFFLTDCKKQYFVVKVITKKQDEKSGKAFFKCKIIKSEFELLPHLPFTRAFSLLIEILIHSSRLLYFSTESNKTDTILEDLERIILEYAKIIRRVVPEESIYIELLEKILKKLNLKE